MGANAVGHRKLFPFSPIQRRRGGVSKNATQKDVTLTLHLNVSNVRLSKIFART